MALPSDGQLVMQTTTLPDGRQLQIDHEGPAGNWVARIVGEQSSPVAGRWLVVVLADLLGLPQGRKPDWALDVVRELTGRDTAVGRRYPCPCCDFLTLAEPPTGTSAICPVCRWEDDAEQFSDMARAGGANQVSLREARENFRAHGVSDPRHSELARPPKPEEWP